MLKKALAVVVVLAAVVLGYGYWHQRTFATLHVGLRDGTQQRSWRPLPNAQLRLLDAHGRELAQARSGSDGVVHLSDPPRYACHTIERQATTSADARAAWQQCFKAQSRWLAGWVERLAAADVAVGNCRLRAPLHVRRYGDAWWLWWVPLPHAGGTPYGYYSAELTIDALACEALPAG